MPGTWRGRVRVVSTVWVGAVCLVAVPACGGDDTGGATDSPPATEHPAGAGTSPARGSFYAEGVPSVGSDTIWIGGGLVGDPVESTWRAVDGFAEYDLDGTQRRHVRVEPPPGSAWFFAEVPDGGRRDLAVAVSCPVPGGEEPGCGELQGVHVLDLDRGTSRRVVDADGDAVLSEGTARVLGWGPGGLLVALAGPSPGLPLLAGVRIVEVDLDREGDAVARPVVSSPVSDLQWWCVDAAGDLVEARPTLAGSVLQGVTYLRHRAVDHGDGAETVLGEQSDLPPGTNGGLLVCGSTGAVHGIAEGYESIAVTTFPAGGGPAVTRTIQGGTSSSVSSVQPHPDGSTTAGVVSGDGTHRTVLLLTPAGELLVEAQVQAPASSRFLAVQRDPGGEVSDLSAVAAAVPSSDRRSVEVVPVG